MIPITVFTGFLGAGKTTLILSLLPKLPKDYKVCLLKNEFGDVEGVYLASSVENNTHMIRCQSTASLRNSPA